MYEWEGKCRHQNIPSNIDVNEGGADQVEAWDKVDIGRTQQSRKWRSNIRAAMCGERHDSHDNDEISVCGGLEKEVNALDDVDSDAELLDCN
ncbi:hypothetical protein Tco_1162126 [Tanacetum coccineum]